MILLDTNIVSELMRPVPDENVMAWVNEVDGGDLYLSSITVAEIRYGLAIMPGGKRQQSLLERFDNFITLGFSRRVLPFDEQAANVYGSLMAKQKNDGRTMSALDGQIASIASTHDLELATRNIKDFDGIGIGLVNPWIR